MHAHNHLYIGIHSGARTTSQLPFIITMQITHTHVKKQTIPNGKQENFRENITKQGKAMHNFLNNKFFEIKHFQPTLDSVVSLSKYPYGTIRFWNIIWLEWATVLP